MPVTIAMPEDAPTLVKLINSAYRGDQSKKGWTTEADIIGGEYRILLPDLEALIQKQGVVFLLSVNEEQQTEGSVFLEKRGDQLYLGMLSVHPDLQTRGTGKQLMLAAEDQARQMGCQSIIMRVIHLRKELIDWYLRRGYYDTGKTEAYIPPSYESVSIPFHFVILQKDL